MPTAPYRAILCPVDFSSCSAESLKVGAQLALTGGVPLKVVYATHFEAPPYFNESAQMELAKQLVNAQTGRAGRARLVVRAASTRRHECRYEILERPPVDAIRHVAEELPGCWIVMGTHGRTGLKRLLLGSVTERTLREAGVPVSPFPRPLSDNEKETHARLAVRSPGDRRLLRPDEVGAAQPGRAHLNGQLLRRRVPASCRQPD
jgi:universal stress protein A